MMRRFQVAAAGKAQNAPKAPGGQVTQHPAAARFAQPHDARIEAVAAVPRRRLGGVGGALLAMQREHGNRAVQRMVSQARTAPVIQAKLTAGPAGDRCEREADQVARQVMRGGTAAVGQSPGGAGQAVAPGVTAAIRRVRGRGRPLPERYRSRMEQALSADFRGVRLHDDTEADRLSRVLRARAFTTGQDVFLRRGEPGLSSGSGQELIAHELAHVAQQASGTHAEGTQAGPAQAGPAQAGPAQAGGTQASGAPVIQCKLVQIAGDPDHLEDDKTGIKARLKTGSTVLYVGDHDGQDYEIETATSGEQTFVLSKPVTGFFISTAPPTFTLGQQQPTTGQPTTGQTTGQPTTGQTTGQPTVPQTTAPPPPVWNPPPISNPWTSPRGGTTFSFSPSRDHPYRRGAPSGKYSGKPRRKAAGYDNPSQFHTNMLPLWEAAAQSPKPSSVTDDTSLRKWLKDDSRRLLVTSPGRSRSKVIKGYKDSGTKSAVVLGHQPSAGSHFNLTGHTQPRSSNLSHNRSTGAYHGLEDYLWSAASGASEPPYESPRPDRGSHPTFYNPSEPGFTGGPWHSYAPESDQSMIGYIEGKLNGVATTAATDPDYQQAVTELGKLKTLYSTAAAKGLLGMIQQKGW